MPTNYQSIADENLRKYGTATGDYGPVLLAGIYSERTHFIYELLQNAEDALARRGRADQSGQRPSGTVKFDLYYDRLEFRHCGRPFDEADVKGICGLVSSTARGDVNRIGNFGIGFKSVYAYTTTPEVHSGDEHFVVRNYVLPSPTNSRAVDEGVTLFVFRFDRENVSPKAAFDEIADRLAKLERETLLFLDCIDEIQWTIEGYSSGRYSRQIRQTGKGYRIAQLVLKQAEQLNESPFLVFDASPDAPATERTAVAFLLNESPNVNALGYSVSPLHSSPLSVFFPTKIETKLKFLVHGPYRTTPTRETIHEDNPENRELIERTVELLATTLNRSRELGLLTPGFLECLPLRETDFSDRVFFKPFFSKVKDILQSEPLLPTDRGGFASADQIRIAGSQAIRDLLTDEQLTTLLGAEKPLGWLTGSITAAKSSDLFHYLTKSLGIQEITPERLAGAITPQFIQAQTDEWVAGFYSFLATQEALWRQAAHHRPAGPLRSKAFIRLSDGTHVAPFHADGTHQAYLPPDEGGSEFPLVSRAVADYPQAKEFLKKMGLQTPDVVAETLRKVLPRYELDNAVTPESHLLNLGFIFRALETPQSESKKQLEAKLRETAFVLARDNSTGKTTYKRPGEVYWQTSALTKYFTGAGESIWFLTDEIPENLIAAFSKLGVADRPRRIRIEGSLDDQHLRTLRGGTNETERISVDDYELQGLRGFLQHMRGASPDERTDSAFALWGFLMQEAEKTSQRGEDDFFWGKYRWSYRGERSARFEPQFMKLLKGDFWIPAKDGQFHTPNEISLDDLPSGFAENEFLAKHLGLLSEKEQVLARKIGIDPQLIAYLKSNPEAQRKLQRSIAQNRIQQAVEQATDQASFSDNEPNAEKSGTPDTSRERSGSLGGSSTRIETRVYVEHERASDETVERGGNQARNSVDAAGIQRVLAYEKENGRIAVEQAHSNPGFDIRSEDDGGCVRYIEVKSLADSWSGRGVALSATQFEEAQKRGEEFWLYIVEQAESDHAKISTIRNPANSIRFYLFDRGWRSLSEAQDDG